MICNICSKDNALGALFCRHCGNKLSSEVLFKSSNTQTIGEISANKKTKGIGRIIKILLIAIPVLIIILSIFITLIKKQKTYSSAELFDKYKDSIVQVGTFDNKGKESTYGTGIIISDDGLVLTNAHVLSNANNAYIKTHTGAYYSTDSFFDANGNYSPDVFIDDYFDLATFKVQAKNLKPVSIHNQPVPLVGSKVFCIGNPLLMANTLSEGIVSSIREDGLISLIQITAAISSGSSGGAMFDSYGNLIGVTTSTLKNGQNINFAIPIKYTIDLLYKYMLTESANLKLPQKDILANLDLEKNLIKTLTQKKEELKEYSDSLRLEIKNTKGKKALNPLMNWITANSYLMSIDSRIKAYNEAENKYVLVNNNISTNESNVTPNMQGLYTRTSITPTCENYFDANIQVIQNNNNLIIRGKDTGLDSIGKISSDGKISVNLAWSDGTPYPCDGFVIKNIVSGECKFSKKICHYSYVKQ